MTSFACGITHFLNGMFYFSCHTRCTHENSPFELLRGASHIHESLSGLRLQISPDAFFQVNTSAAETLYDIIREVSEVDKTCCLLDLCCGTGKYHYAEYFITAMDWYDHS